MHFWRRLSLALIVCTIVALYYRSQTRVTHDAARGTRRKKPHLQPGTRRYPVASYAALPRGRAKSLPQIQYDFGRQGESAQARKIRLDRQAAVKKAFIHAWDGYKFHAFAKDEVTPLSGSWRNSFGGWGATMVDTMDFLWLLGMQGDFDMSVDVVSKTDFSTNSEDVLNVFETTIRYLGGLLSAYDISGQQYSPLLRKAQELGDVLYMAFDTPNYMPATRWQWEETAQGLPLKANSQVLLAELGSLTLEFTRLSQLTGDPKYFDAVQRISETLYQVQNQTQIPGLWPTIIDAESLDFSSRHFTMGGMVDSAYEYLPKEFLLLGGLDDMYRVMYITALTQAKKYLFYRPLVPRNEDILFSGNAGVLQSGEIVHEAQGQHLTCFLGGMVAMAAKVFSTPSDLGIARKLVDGCVWAYHSMPSGLMPEVFHTHACQVGAQPRHADGQSASDCVWQEDTWYTAIAQRFGSKQDTAQMAPIEAGKFWAHERSLHQGYTDVVDHSYLLRPEAIESLFVLYRITGDADLLDEAWSMFQAIEGATRTRIAHAAVYDVRSDPEHVVHSDRMESFWLAETLKYFWLIFADTNVVSLDEWVLNTEAHMFRRPQSGDAMG